MICFVEHNEDAEEVGHNKSHVMLSALCVVRAPSAAFHRYGSRVSRSKHKVVIILQKGEKHSYTVSRFSSRNCYAARSQQLFFSAITAPGK